jgi:hypothetical protein
MLRRSLTRRVGRDTGHGSWRTDLKQWVSDVPASVQASGRHGAILQE